MKPAHGRLSTSVGYSSQTIHLKRQTERTSASTYRTTRHDTHKAHRLVQKLYRHISIPRRFVGRQKPMIFICGITDDRGLWFRRVFSPWVLWNFSNHSIFKRSAGENLQNWCHLALRYYRRSFSSQPRVEFNFWLAHASNRGNSFIVRLSAPQEPNTMSLLGISPMATSRSDIGEFVFKPMTVVGKTIAVPATK